jgi:hypothetical protein
MKPAFKLDARPRRPHPLLSEPPADYFDKLPTRIMARLPQADERPAASAWNWLAALSPALRTGLASVAVLGTFATSFYLSGSLPLVPATGNTAALDAVPRTELANYLLTSGARVETSDLATLTAAHPNIANSFLRVSAEELDDALDAQPTDDPTYL